MHGQVEGKLSTFLVLAQQVAVRVHTLRFGAEPPQNSDKLKIQPVSRPRTHCACLSQLQVLWLHYPGARSALKEPTPSLRSPLLQGAGLDLVHIQAQAKRTRFYLQNTTQRQPEKQARFRAKSGSPGAPSQPSLRLSAQQPGAGSKIPKATGHTRKINWHGCAFILLDPHHHQNRQGA